MKVRAAWYNAAQMDSALPSFKLWLAFGLGPCPQRLTLALPKAY